MEQSDPLFFGVAALAVVFAGVSKAGFGSGAAFAASAILSIIIDPGRALGIMLPLLMLIDAVTLKPYWKKWNLPQARVLIGAGIPGVILGALLYRSVDDDMLRILMGVIALAFVIWQYLSQRGRIPTSERQLPAWVGWIAGITAGFTSFVSHAGGPPAAVYLLSFRPSKTEYQATTVLVFWAINIAKFVPYVMLGAITMATVPIVLKLAPFALLGAWIGVRLHHLMPERAFFVMTYVLLVITGSKLIWDGLF